MTDVITSTDPTAARRRPGVPIGLPKSIEWPTITVAAAAWTGLIGGVLTHQVLAWWITIPVVAMASGLYASLQHEVSHGHPTPWPLVNSAIVGVPFGLVYPFARFCDLHLAHHSDPSQLTEPGLDNESRYCSPEVWERSGRVKRLVLRAERTLTGHLTIGVVRGSLGYVAGDLRAALGNRRIGLIWIRHAIAVAILVTLLVLLGMPPFQYAIGAVYGRVFFTGLRTFAEHRAVPEGTRSAVVQARLPMRVMFLNNNLHHTHHAAPGAAWYRLPQLAEELGSSELARQGAGLYAGGYLEIARRYAFRPFCQPVHP